MHADVLDNDPQFAQMLWVQRRNRVLRALYAYVIAYLAIFFATVAFAPFPTPVVFMGLFVGQLLLILDLAVLGSFMLFHLATNPRVSGNGKLFWFIATVSTGLAGFMYYELEIFSETGLEEA